MKRYDNDRLCLYISKLHLVDYDKRREIQYALENMAQEMLKDVDPGDDYK